MGPISALLQHYQGAAFGQGQQNRAGTTPILARLMKIQEEMAKKDLESGQTEIAPAYAWSHR